MIRAGHAQAINSHARDLTGTHTNVAEDDIVRARQTHRMPLNHDTLARRSLSG